MTNEIEKAITYFEALLERLGNGDSDNAVCATALAALREKQEREMRSGMSEQRLIDANRLIDFIDCGHLRNPLELCFSGSEVVNMLDSAPTVPAEVVVHCRDCKYKAQAKVNINGFLICHASGMEITDDDFCSYGERRESEVEK